MSNTDTERLQPGDKVHYSAPHGAHPVHFSKSKNTKS